MTTAPPSPKRQKRSEARMAERPTRSSGACVRACVRVCVRVCMRVCACVRVRVYTLIASCYSLGLGWGFDSHLL